MQLNSKRHKIKQTLGNCFKYLLRKSGLNSRGNICQEPPRGLLSSLTSNNPKEKKQLFLWWTNILLKSMKFITFALIVKNGTFKLSVIYSSHVFHKNIEFCVRKWTEFNASINVHKIHNFARLAVQKYLVIRQWKLVESCILELLSVKTLTHARSLTRPGKVKVEPSFTFVLYKAKPKLWPLPLLMLNFSIGNTLSLVIDWKVYIGKYS